jgi:glutamate N-acetyltransferase/amino-acid N-acetyltransferase
VSTGLRSIRVPGFRAAGVRCGVKRRGLDVALIAADSPAAAAGVFTRSTVVGAPVELSRRRVQRGWVRAVVANSGVSNVAMGARGRRDAAAMAAAAARAVGAADREVLVASTGVIGQPLPLDRIRRGIEGAARALAPSGWGDAARAIMTTDTFPKLAQTRFRLGGRRVTLAGIAKGSGMIAPNMGTMLAFLATDAAAAPGLLRRVLREVVAESFNRVSVDGETSTSDTLLLLASGAAGNPALTAAGSPGAARLRDAALEVARSLARDLARDGEGATRLVTVRVHGARSRRQADVAARRIANSPLVKTALFGGDPNWGRILQTVGAGEVALDLSRTEVTLGGVTVFRHGAPTGPAARRRAAVGMARREVEVAVHLAAGRASAWMWTCDLSYEYVRVNAEYTT